MAANTLTEEQRNDIARRLAAGEKPADIAAAVGTSIANVKYHASKKRPIIEAARQERITEAITAGLSVVDARVAQLEWLNTQLAADLANGFYGVDIKMSATGKTVEVPAFKAQQVAQLRGTLDDIAKERGGRRTNVKVDGDVTHTYTLRFDRADDATLGGTDDPA